MGCKCWHEQSNGDVICLDAAQGTLQALVATEIWAARGLQALDAKHQASHQQGLGRELFAGMRCNVLSAEEGAVTWATHSMNE
jgi:phosphogluconate dehydratase